MVKALRKYFTIFMYSLKRSTVFIWDYLFSVISYTVHIFVFNSLWDFILKDGSLFGYTRSELIWYIILAEFITYSSVKLYQRITDMVKDGTIANMLIKPMNTLLLVVAEESGVIIKVIINAIAAFVLGNVFGGNIEVSLAANIFFLISCFFAFVIATEIQLIIGLFSFYIEETKGFWLIIQKIQFLLVFVPIEFYSEIIQKVLFFVPTTHMVYTPATILIKYDFSNTIILLAMQVLTMLILTIITKILYKKGVRKINANGG